MKLRSFRSVYVYYIQNLDLILVLVMNFQDYLELSHQNFSCSKDTFRYDLYNFIIGILLGKNVPTGLLINCRYHLLSKISTAGPVIKMLAAYIVKAFMKVLLTSRRLRSLQHTSIIFSTYNHCL